MLSLLQAAIVNDVVHCELFHRLLDAKDLRHDVHETRGKAIVDIRLRPLSDAASFTSRFGCKTLAAV